MKIKPLILSVAALAVAVGIAVWFDRPDSAAPAADSRSGGGLLDDEALRTVDTVVLAGADGASVHMELSASGYWIVPDADGFPADFQKLLRLVESLRSATVVRKVTDQPERIQRLELGRNRITLRAGERILLDILTGRAHESGGLFFQWADEPSAWLLSSQPWIDTQSDNWVDKGFIGMTPESIQSLAELSPANAEVLWQSSRPDVDTGFSTPESDAVDAAKVQQLARSFAQMRFTRTEAINSPVATSAAMHRRVFEIATFDGARLRFAISRTPESVITPAVERMPWEMSDEELAAEAEPQTIPAGPVIVQLEETPVNSAWAQIALNTAFVVADFIYNQLP